MVVGVVSDSTWQPNMTCQYLYSIKEIYSQLCENVEIHLPFPPYLDETEFSYSLSY